MRCDRNGVQKEWGTERMSCGMNDWVRKEWGTEGIRSGRNGVRMEQDVDPMCAREEIVAVADKTDKLCLCVYVGGVLVKHIN